LRERRLELRQNLLELDQSLLNIEASVVEAASQIDAAYKELEASIRATLAVHSELQYLTDRWKDAFRDETQRSLLLDQLLNAQLQLLQSENSWARAQSDHMIAIAKLKLVTATLLSTSVQ
jgi:outer membrane protein TolC